MTSREVYMLKAHRNARARALKAAGFEVRKLRSSNQLLHPMFVEDYEIVTGVKLTAADKGLGNTIYKTPFKVLYSVVWLERYDHVMAGKAHGGPVCTYGEWGANARRLSREVRRSALILRAAST